MRCREEDIRPILDKELKTSAINSNSLERFIFLLQLVRVLLVHISKCSHIQVVLWVHLPIPANNNNTNTNNIASVQYQH